MKREFLKELGLSDDVIDKIMAENGKDVESEKAKIAAKEAEIKNITAQLSEANKQIEAFKGMDIDGIKKAADEWKTKYETAKAESEKELQALKLESALETALIAGKAKNTIAVKALLNKDIIKLDGDKLLGLEEQLAKLKKDAAYLFEEETDASKMKIDSGKQHNEKPGKEQPTTLLGALKEKYENKE